MLPRPRPCRFPLLRLLALAWLACGVLAEPLASALGELHAFGHAETALHVHADGDRQPHDDDDAGLLHALMHGGHCHGHCAAILPPLALSTPPTGSVALPLVAQVPSHQHLLSTLLRPPILG